MSLDLQQTKTFSNGFVARLCLLIAASLPWSCTGDAAKGKRTQVPGRADVLIGPTEVCVPVDAWLLLRKSDRTCALRVVDVWLKGEATHARIETASLIDGRWSRGTVEVSEYPLVGPHPLSFQRGNVEVPCTTFSVAYSRPSCISLYAGGGEGPGDRIEAAPSAWTNLNSVDPANPRLTWYTADDQRADVVELTRLPGGE